MTQPHLSFRDRLQQPAPILTDGAMGTMLHARGVSINAVFDQLNLTQPDIVREVHTEYLQAGAELIETNTFGANRFKLAEHGLDDKVALINETGAQLARHAVTAHTRATGAQAYVAGSVGPLGVQLQPFGRVREEEAQAAFAEQIGGLAAGGVDALIFETFTDLAQLQLALKAAHAVAPDLPIIAQMTFGGDDRTVFGYLPGRVAAELLDAGADVVGVNCSGGPAQITRVLAAMHSSNPNAHFSAMPNAGFPQFVGGRTMYPATVEYFAEYALTFEGLGAQIIGGCCGTTPEHIAAMRAALDHRERSGGSLLIEDDADEEGETVAEGQSELAHLLANGTFVISVEVNPPRGHNFERLLDSARLLRDAGASVLNVADSPTARMRVSPWAVCQTLESRLGIETVLHFPTRGRNLLRIQGDLLGAHALGLRNLFVCMGDPTRIGDYPDAMDNYDIPPTGLIRLTKEKMNAGLDQAGNNIGQPTSFTVGCALNMGAADLDKEIELLRKKLDAGADFALVQPVFDPSVAETFLERWETLQGERLRLPLLMGIMPLYSLKHALFLNNEIPGINIPSAILKRIEDAGDDAAQEGVRVAQALLHDLHDLVQGAYIIPAFGRYELAAQIIDTVAV